MNQAAFVAIDIVAIGVLAYAIYFRRHGRKDMLLAYVGLNVGAMALTMTLVSASVGVGLGLGLFGVLSIIRLRSAEMLQHEIAYYLVALILGLLMGVGPEPGWSAPAMATLLIAVIYVVDHPRLLARDRRQMVTLDEAIATEPELIARLENLLEADVKTVIVRRVDLFRNTTSVDVRYRLR